MGAAEVYDFSEHPEDQGDDGQPVDDAYLREMEEISAWAYESADYAEWDPDGIHGPRYLKKTDAPRVLLSAFTAYAFRMPTANGYENFSFKGRKHLHQIYDTERRRVLLMCGRQVEKCFAICPTQTVLDAKGMPIPAIDVKVGQKIVSWDEHSESTCTARVVAKKKVGDKPCLCVKTRQGHELRVATTHPILTARGWTEAKDLKVGSRVGAIRRGGEFGEYRVDPRWLRLCPYMIADGSLCTNGYLSFSKKDGVVQSEFMAQLTGEYAAKVTTLAQDGLGRDHRLSYCDALKAKLTEVGLWGCHAADKFIPEEVFSYTREDTATFLNRLWACDGAVGHPTPVKYDIEYASISERLVRQVQALLWKFGIPTSYRKYQPRAYRNTDKWSRIIRVETREGIRRFLQDIGALSKSEGVPLPGKSVPERGNRDTIPAELIRAIVERALPDGISLRSIGIDSFPRAGVTQDRLRTLISRLNEVHADTSALAMLLDSDLYWDAVESIEELGELPCFDIEVARTHNFLLNGVFTHNSTLLGNRAIGLSCLIPAYKTLYVSPSATQTKTFSNDRLKEPIETSPILRTFTTRMLSQNVFEKQFVNRSKITLRNAFLNADRARGVPAHQLSIDEIQNILSDNIPIIEQCLAHSPEQLKRYTYSGTPLTLDNIIEDYWSQRSTQNEWAVPCDCSLGEGGRFWNILGEKNIGRKYLICEKCGKQLNSMHEDAQWASAAEYDPVHTPFEGYRIPQLMVPWLDWNELLYNFNNYPRNKFYNEVLGVSFDTGLRPLTKAQVVACCRPDVYMSDAHKYQRLSFSQEIFAGVDWGSGEHSFTVVSLGLYIDRKFRIFYTHRFVGEDTEPERQLQKLDELFRAFNVRIIGVDYGGGYHPNDFLLRRFGRERVQKYQYVARLSTKVRWESKLMRWVVHRTEVMSAIFNAIKRGNVFEFPRWEEFKDPYAQDMLNIFSEYNEKLRMIQYGHTAGKTDDTFHSVLYCFLASMIRVPRPDIISPNKETERTGGLISQYSGPVDQG